MNYVALFFIGVTLCNAIPHLVAGLQGTPFPTPFARPRGVGNSSSLINFLWGAFNLTVGLFLLSNYPFAIGANPECLAVAAGALVLGLHLSIRFGKLRDPRRNS